MKTKKWLSILLEVIKIIIAGLAGGAGASALM